MRRRLQRQPGSATPEEEGPEARARHRRGVARRLRQVLRDEALDGEKIDEEVRRRLHAVVADKLPGHGINDPSFIQPTRPMSASFSSVSSSVP